MMSGARSSPRRDQLDPVVVHARREAVAILLAFGACLIWSVTWCYLAGYHGSAGADLSKVLGMPGWVFWGVIVPWLAADLFAVWFCFFFVADDPLGEPEEEADPSESPAGDCGPDQEARHG